ncbi:GerW family sporulation protein [Acutalibacter sp. 1XD8-36]|uniref:GerW family sporulation protein n=1 Tax=Acutalibacter sp. 1XD8-36 TaxID=2320852 RepID=UPI0014121EF6|nr:GerW family sporulation protein [Acutalibacter sp. 1XD8-36]NBJ90542.1 sporulation protein YtfJ [Acutalibacter sp. 1XD8-36]
MSSNKVNDLLGVSMDKIKQMVDVNTVVGDPVTTPDGTTVIPISRVNYGFAAGGSDLPSKSQPTGGLFAGGSGAGVTVSPVAFLSIHNGNVRVIQIEPYFSPVDRALEKIPDIADMLSSLFKKKGEPEEIVPAPDGVPASTEKETAE